MSQAEPRLSGWRLAAFAAVTLPIAGGALPVVVYLPPIYAQHFGLTLGTIGLIFLIGRIWDTISDPLIGTLSDRTRTRFGRRRPYMVAGGLVFGLSALLLFFPPDHITPTRLGVALFLFYLGWTMIQLPMFAWSGELSGLYHERTRIVTYQQVVAAISLLIVLVLPTIADQIRPDDVRFKLTLMGGSIILTLLPTLILSLIAFPEPPLPRHRPARLGFLQSLRLIFADRLLLRVLGSDFAVTLAQYVRSTLFVFFVAQYVGLPRWASGLFLFQFLFAIAAGPIWLRIGYRFGKHRAAVLGELAQMAVNLGLLFVTPGALPVLLILTLFQGLAQNSGNQMLRSIVADLTDRHRLETGADRAGLYFSVFSLSGKAAMAVAVGVALPLVAWLGFHPRGVNAPAALLHLKLVFALGPAIAHALSAFLISGFPLDEVRHGEIRRALDEHEAFVPILAE